MLMPLIFRPKENKVLSWLKKYWPWFGLAVFLFIILILLLPYMFRPWTKYPEAIRAEIAWRSFKASFTGNCREQCLVNRQSYAAYWRPYFKKYPDVATEKYREVFAENGAELQAASIKIMAADNGHLTLPTILADVISNPESSLENKRLIVTYFPAAFQDEKWLELIRAQVMSAEPSLEDRIYALRLLSAFPNEDTKALIKRVILSVAPTELLNTAFLVLGAWPADSLSWSTAEINTLYTLIIESESGPARWRRLWLLSETNNEAHEEQRSLLIALANNLGLDLISRGLAAEALNKIFNLEIKTPLPAASDWDKFYEQI